MFGGRVRVLVIAMMGCAAPEGVADGPTVQFETTAGDFAIATYASQAPLTTMNFLDYVESGFYDGSDGAGVTQFHRVVPGFVVQGGGLDIEGDEKPTGDPIANESRVSDLANTRGTVAMARTSDPDSATAQWFVNLVDNGFLDRGDGYAVFGEVLEGMEVIDAIAGVPLLGEQPVDPILIERVTLR